MSDDKRYKYTCYLAGFIESAPSEADNWRKKISELLVSSDLLIYNPIEKEAIKTGKPACEHINYIVGLKKSGKYEIFDKEMDKIWLANIKRTKDLVRLFKLLQDRAFVDGNKKDEINSWGDYEAVARSSWIIAYIKKDKQTIGTIGEIFESMLLNIPVYLIIDTPKTETNSTLLYWVRYSEGEIFYSVNDCAKYIREKYNLTEPKIESEKKE